MKTCTKCRNSQELAVFCKDKYKPDGLHSWCKACRSIQGVAYRVVNHGKGKERMALWQRLNPLKTAITQKKHNDAHKAQRNAGSRLWQKENKARDAERSARQRVGVKQSSPAWANKFFIGEIYDMAQRRTKATGFRWEVDHYYPLNSKWVCGLHIETNLRVIPASINLSKGNRRVQPNGGGLSQ